LIAESIKVIDGVLCWRGTPDGEWEQYNINAITTALVAERGYVKDLERDNERMKFVISRMKDVLK
jgi:hypothetical protein